jgi:ankyrin repeat protein
MQSATQEHILTLAQAGQAEDLERLVAQLTLRTVVAAVRLAAANGHIACVRVLLAQERGHRVHLISHALLTAAGHGEAECVRALCAAKADASAKFYQAYPECTALAMAARHGCTDTVRALLEADAQLYGLDDNEWPATSDAAAESGNDAALLLLLEAGSPLPRLAGAVRRCSTETLQILLEAKAGVNTISVGLDGEQMTPIHEAAAFGRADVVHMLCAAKASMVDRSWRRTPLDIARNLGHADVVRALCDAKADPNA